MSLSRGEMAEVATAMALLFTLGLLAALLWSSGAW